MVLLHQARISIICLKDRYTLAVIAAGGCEIDTTVVVTGSSPVSISVYNNKC